MSGYRKLGRPTDQRRAMLRGMVTYLLENGAIETTLMRAKEVRRITEKMITLGKNDTLHSKRQALSYITKEDVVNKLFTEIGPSYAERNGGYTRIIKTGNRLGDNAAMCFIELVDYNENMLKDTAAKKAPKTRRSRKKATAAVTEAPAAEAASEEKAAE